MKRLSFGDLGPKYMLFNVTSPDGEVYELRIRAMTEADVNAVNAGVDEPQPPIVERFAGKDKGYVKEKNLDDPEYQKKVTEVNRQRMYRLLASAVDLEIPGDTIAEKADALQKEGVPAWLLARAVELINRTLGLNVEDVRARADTFQPS